MSRLWVIVLCCCVWIVTPSLASRASCVSPEVEIIQGSKGITKEPPIMAKVSEDGYVRVVGEHFFNGCPDSNDGGGFFGCGEDAERFRRMLDIPVAVKGPVPRSIFGDEKRWELLHYHGWTSSYELLDVAELDFETDIGLGTIDSDGGYNIDERIEIPELERGVYFLEIGPVMVLFRYLP